MIVLLVLGVLQTILQIVKWIAQMNVEERQYSIALTYVVAMLNMMNAEFVMEMELFTNVDAMTLQMDYVIAMET